MVNVIIFFLAVFVLLESFSRVSRALGIKPPLEILLASVTLLWSWTVGVTWILSVLHILTGESFGVAVAATVVLILVLFRKHETSLFAGISDLFFNCYGFVKEKKIFVFVLLLPLVWTIWAVIRILLLPPLNYDSMTYHLPMIANWLQHGTLAMYATNTYRQIIFPVNAEILQMFHVIFIQNDSIVELVQLESFLVCYVGVYVISRKAGMSKGWSLNASCILLTVPMALLQSCTTQNDLVVAAALVLSMVWLGCYISDPGIKPLFLLSLALGFLLGVKINMIISLAVLVFCTFFVFWSKRNIGFKKSHLFAFILMVLFSGTLLGSEIYIRNLLVFKKMLPVELVPGPMESHFAIGMSTLTENFIFLGKWWFVTCWDYLSPATWNHNFSHYGLLFSYVVLPFACLSGIALLMRALSRERLETERLLPLVVFAVIIGSLVGFFLSHRPRPYDLRYLIFVPVGLSPVAFWFLSRMKAKLETIVAVIVVVISLPTMVLAATLDDGKTIQKAYSLEPGERTTANLGEYGFPQTLRAFDRVVKEGESVIYCGTEDNWSYTLFGHDFSRRIYYASSLDKVLSCLDNYPIAWVMVHQQYTEIIDYLTKNNTLFKKVRVEGDKGDRLYFLFRFFPENWSEVWFDGIYGDHWSSRGFSISAATPGIFTVVLTVPHRYNDTVSLGYRMLGEEFKYFYWAKPGDYTVEIPLSKAGTIFCVPSRFFNTTAEGLDNDNRDLGFMIQKIEFVKNGESNRIVVYK